MKVYYFTQVLKQGDIKQGVNIKTSVQPSYSNLETQIRIYCKSYRGAQAKIETVFKNQVC